MDSGARVRYPPGPRGQPIPFSPGSDSLACSMEHGGLVRLILRSMKPVNLCITTSKCRWWQRDTSEFLMSQGLFSSRSGAGSDEKVLLNGFSGETRRGALCHKTGEAKGLMSTLQMACRCCHRQVFTTCPWLRSKQKGPPLPLMSKRNRYRSR